MMEGIPKKEKISEDEISEETEDVPMDEKTRKELKEKLRQIIDAHNE